MHMFVFFNSRWDKGYKKLTLLNQKVEGGHNWNISTQQHPKSKQTDYWTQDGAKKLLDLTLHFSISYLT